MKHLRTAAMGLGILIQASRALPGQGDADIGGAVIYDYDASTHLGDPIFGTLVADMQRDHPGRCSHGGPVCLQYQNGVIAAFYANTSDHNTDGWTEYALSEDGGRTWDKYNRLKYSFDCYERNPKEPAWVEEGLVTGKGTAVLFLTHFRKNERIGNGIMRSCDNGSTWTAYEPFGPGVVGYPCAVAVSGDTSYVLFDSNQGRHLLYASTDDGETWQKRSALPLDEDKWYGALCVMGDGRLLAGAYTEKDESSFYYCISEDAGKAWSEQKAAKLDKKIRDPELAWIGGSYYLHGRAGQQGPGAHRFVLYKSGNGEDWSEGIIVSSDDHGPDGYSHNCLIRKGEKAEQDKLMVLYSIIYQGRDTNEYVFFITPKAGTLRK